MSQAARKRLFLNSPEKSVETSHFQISNLRCWVDEIKKSMKNRKEYDV